MAPHFHGHNRPTEVATNQVVASPLHGVTRRAVGTIVPGGNRSHAQRSQIIMTHPMKSRTLSAAQRLAVGGIIVAVAACGDATSIQPSNSSPTIDAPTSTTNQLSVSSSLPTTIAAGSSTPVTTQPTSTTAGSTSQGQEDGPVLLREFMVDGITVRVATVSEQLPERANQVRLTGTVIDEGDGPRACIGGVLDSYPPQCDGPVVDGLAMGDWAETSNGVAFGERTIDVTWPPVNDHVTLLAEGQPRVPQSIQYPTLELPADCSKIEKFVDIAQLNDYATAHPDTTALPYVVGAQQTGVLPVVGDIEVVRAALSDGDIVPCLTTAEFSAAELNAAQDAINAELRADPNVLGASGSNVFYRVTVEVVAADASTAKTIAGLVDDPSIVIVFGTAAITGP